MYLDYKQLLNNNLESLEQLYQEKEFKGNRKSLLRLINRNWVYEVNRLLEQSDNQPIPDKLDIVDVEVDGTLYGILGIFHPERPSALHQNLVALAISERNNWIAEQYITSIFDFDLSYDIIEINDHELIKWRKLSYFWSGLKSGVSVVNLFRNYDVEDEEEDDILNIYSVPYKIVAGNDKVPYNIEIELAENGGSYSSSLRRSGYMAEMLKNWNVKGSKNILAGIGHTAEIEHFLKHQIKDQEVIDVAGYHANLLNTDPNKLYTMINNMDRNNDLFKNFGRTIVYGGIAGLISKYLLSN